MNIIDRYCAEVSRVSSAYEYARYMHSITFTIYQLLDVKTVQLPDMPSTFLELTTTSYSVASGVKRELFRLMLNAGLKPRYSIYGDIYTNREISFKVISRRQKGICPFGADCISSPKAIIRMTFYTYEIRRKA